jgi:Pyruvate flavodoxin/ferredoxin oxidoreductase, thiamine diP-bdg
LIIDGNDAVARIAYALSEVRALSIFGDHSDVMAARATGWAMLSSASVQEAHDLALIAHSATLESRIPFLHFFDAFRTSHEIADVTLLTSDDMRWMIDLELVLDRSLAGPDAGPSGDPRHGAESRRFFQARERSSPFYRDCATIVDQTMERVEETRPHPRHISAGEAAFLLAFRHGCRDARAGDPNQHLRLTLRGRGDPGFFKKLLELDRMVEQGILQSRRGDDEQQMFQYLAGLNEGSAIVLGRQEDERGCASDWLSVGPDVSQHPDSRGVERPREPGPGDETGQAGRLPCAQLTDACRNGIRGFNAARNGGPSSTAGEVDQLRGPISRLRRSQLQSFRKSMENIADGLHCRWNDRRILQCG